MDLSFLIGKLLLFCPFLFFIIISLKRNEDYIIQPVSVSTSIILLLLMSILMVLTPIEMGNDKYYYMLEFLGDTQERDNEMGWVLYNSILRLVFGGNFILFFLFSSLLYSYSYFFLARKLFPKETMGYFILMTVGMMGFVSYGSNTIRAGISIAFLFFSISLPLKLKYRVFLFVLAVITHKAMIIPVVAFLSSYFIKNKRLVECFWIFCLLFSLIDIDLATLFEKVGFFDQRVEEYTSSIGGDNDYGSRFRYDFLLYSIVPIYIANIWMNRYQYYNSMYELVYRSYILSNAIWVLVIRVAFSDRIAYLSWFLIPFLVLYPLLNGELMMKNVQKILVVVIGMFVCLNLALGLR